MIFCTDVAFYRGHCRSGCGEVSNVKWMMVWNSCYHRDVICQVVAAQIVGDQVICSAYSHELPKYGIKCGLTNFSASYATGLLLARRLLSQYGLAEVYVGKEEADGELFEVEEEENRRPFKAILDVGLIRTTTGNKVFAAMKGAVDGGMNIPHNEKRFPAYSEEDGFNAEVLKDRILGAHVAEYMTLLKDENPEKYEKQFALFVKNGITPDKVEEMYKTAHKKIRDDPAFTKKPKQNVQDHKKWNQGKITLEQRKQNVLDKIAAAVG